MALAAECLVVHDIRTVPRISLTIAYDSIIQWVSVRGLERAIPSFAWINVRACC